MYNNSNVTTIVFRTSSESWNTQKAISSLEPSSDVDTVTARGKSETSVGRRSSDEDDDDDDASCEWYSGFSVGERDRRSTFERSRTDRGGRVRVHFVCASAVEDRLGIPRICALWAHNLLRACARCVIPRQNNTSSALALGHYQYHCISTVTH